MLGLIQVQHLSRHGTTRYVHGANRLRVRTFRSLATAACRLLGPKLPFGDIFLNDRFAPLLRPSCRSNSDPRSGRSAEPATSALKSSRCEGSER